MEDFREAIAGGGNEGDSQQKGMGEGQGQATQGQGAEGTQDFLGQFSEELRTNPSLQNVKDINDLANQFINAQKMIGGAVKVPGQDATPEQWDEFYNRAGRPEAADNYEFQSSEELSRGDEEIAEMRALFHKAGLNQQQANTLASGHDENLLRKMEAQKLAASQMNEEFLKTAHHQFGGPEGWAAKNAQIQEFLVKNVPQDIRAEMGGLDNKALLSIVYSINEALKAQKEDGPLGQQDVGSQISATNPASLKEKAREALIESRKAAPRSNEAKQKYKEFQKFNAAYYNAIEKKG